MTDDELRSLYQAAVSRRGQAPRGDCPTPEALQELAEHTGAETTRLEVLDHAMLCPSCHRELALLHAVHAAQPRQANLMPRQWLAAAGFLVLLGGGAFLARSIMSHSVDDLTRGGGANGGDQSIAVVAPMSLPATGGIHALVWHAVPGAIRYSAEVLDAKDQVLFAQQTTDTVVPVPTLSAPPAAWWVRATLGDGSERRSPVMQLAPGR
jgi:hypothetical protein